MRCAADMLGSRILVISDPVHQAGFLRSKPILRSAKKQLRRLNAQSSRPTRRVEGAIAAPLPPGDCSGRTSSLTTTAWPPRTRGAVAAIERGFADGPQNPCGMRASSHSPRNAPASQFRDLCASTLAKFHSN